MGHMQPMIGYGTISSIDVSLTSDIENKSLNL